MYYIKKQIPVEVWQFTKENLDSPDSWVRKYPEDITLISQFGGKRIWLEIHTLEGDVRAELGAYIIKGVQGELYPCKEDIFDYTYEPYAETEEKGRLPKWIKTILNKR